MRCPLPVSTTTRVAPDNARGFRVQRPRELIDALWDIDAPESSDGGRSSADEEQPAAKRARQSALSLAKPKAAASAKRTWQVGSKAASETDMQEETLAEPSAAVDAPLDVWRLLDDVMGE